MESRTEEICYCCGAYFFADDVDHGSDRNLGIGVARDPSHFPDPNDAPITEIKTRNGSLFLQILEQ